jgi:hypothetical protein
MPLALVIATDWKLRTAVRAELREIGVEALGLDSPDDVGRSLGGPSIPAATVLEAVPELVSNSSIQALVALIPTILIASRTETVPIPPVAAVLYRPVRVGDIVAKVHALLAHSASA